MWGVMGQSLILLRKMMMLMRNHYPVNCLVGREAKKHSMLWPKGLHNPALPACKHTLYFV